ncbi:MAG: hypothetical protein MUC95_01710 [Spirochaetes bacterium]|nr:hypothetical protein [Spirochaetota bacterium]
MNIKRFFPGFISVIFLLVSCTTDYNKLIGTTEADFYKGKYKEAAKALLPQVNKEDKDQLLFMMECGMMLHAAGDFENSNKILLGAAELSEKIATSISKGAAALLLNETKTNYKGEDFEKVLIHMYLGINFLMLDNPDGARVEFKKINDLLRDIEQTAGREYKQNIMAKYLTGIAFELIADLQNDENDREFAYVEYKQIHELAPNFELVQGDLQRLAKKLDDQEDFNKWVRKFQEKIKIPKNAGEFIMIYHAGQGAIKVSRGKLLEDKAMNASIRMSLGGMSLAQGVSVAAVMISLNTAENPIPKFKKRSNKIDHLVININGKDMGITQMLENIEDTAVKNMEDSYGRMYTKFAAGIATKAVASIAAGLAAKKLAEQSKQLGGFAGLIGAVAGAGTGAALASQIQPDLRCWHTLPANLQVSRLFLKPGKYDIDIQFINRAGAVDRTEKQTIEIKEGKKTFRNYRTLY